MLAQIEEQQIVGVVLLDQPIDVAQRVDDVRLGVKARFAQIPRDGLGGLDRFQIGFQIARGISTTRRSDRNSAR